MKNQKQQNSSRNHCCNKKKIILYCFFLLLSIPITLLVYQIVTLQRSQNQELTSTRESQKNPGYKCNSYGCSNHWHQNIEKGQIDKNFYWYYNIVDPIVISGTILDLPSITAAHKFPTKYVDDVTTYTRLYQQQYQRRSVRDNKPLLFNYNPSIISLATTNLYMSSLLPSDALYLASFRVSTQSYCFHPEDRKRLTMGRKQDVVNHLGLALLGKDFSVIQDVVLDVSTAGFTEHEDFRLFVLHKQIYLTTYDQITPLYFSNKDNSSKLLRRLPVIFGSNNTMPLSASPFTLLDFVFVRSFTSCAPCGKSRGFCGKNFNYFASNTNNTTISGNAVMSETSQHDAYVEIWPSHPHLVRLVNLQEPCQRSVEPVQYANSRMSTESKVLPSFETIEKLFFPTAKTKEVFTRGRGSACCIDMKHPINGQPIRVGIMHSKTPSQDKQRSHYRYNFTGNQYLSSLYALEDKPPFSMVAQSGYFCLPFPTSTEADASPLVKVTIWRHLDVIVPTPSCPRIHFVSGITFEDESSNVLIAYGINDCVSRLIRVPVSEILRLLFGPVRMKDNIVVE